jgi:hypothetical protein
MEADYLSTSHIYFVKQQNRSGSTTIDRVRFSRDWIMSDQSTDFLKWMPFAAAIAAWVAAIFAYLTDRRSSRVLRLAELQEERRRAGLVLYLMRGYVRRTDENRIYAFLLSVSNPSDSNNAIAQIDLRIGYRTSSNYLAAVDIPTSSQNDDMFGKTMEGYNNSCLEIPISVNAHHTAVGWVFFQTKRALFKDCSIDTYTIIATDSHREQSSIETSLVHELVHESETKTN